MTNFTFIRTRLAATSKLTFSLILVSIWLLGAIILWFHTVYQNPENVFKGMLKNNFSTTGFVRTSSSAQNGVNTNEISQLQLGGEPAVQTYTELEQGGDAVTTTTINTGSENYVRYTSINTDRTNEAGKPLDFSKAVNVWAKSTSEATGSNQAVAQMMLGLIPLGNVRAENRAELLRMIEKSDAMTADYKTVKKETKDGRLLYTYDVTINPVPYLEMLKRYGQAVGLGDQVASLNPADYADTQPTTVQLTVDARSRHLVSVSAPGQSTPSETFSSFGIKKAITVPKNTITTEELQQRLSIE